MRIIHLKVQANAREDKIVGFEDYILKIKCKDNRENNKANEKVIKLLSEYFDVPRANIKIVKGMKSSYKIVMIL